jgi:hypothetical protein
LNIHHSGNNSYLVGFQTFNIPARAIKPVGKIFHARKDMMFCESNALLPLPRTALVTPSLLNQQALAVHILPHLVRHGEQTATQSLTMLAAGRETLS